VCTVTNDKMQQQTIKLKIEMTKFAAESAIADGMTFLEKSGKKRGEERA